MQLLIERDGGEATSIQAGACAHDIRTLRFWSVCDRSRRACPLQNGAATLVLSGAYSTFASPIARREERSVFARY